MIVTTGKIIKIDDGVFHFERDSERPGMVVAANMSTVGAGRIELPTNAIEMESFIAAYRRAVAEDVGYRKQENE